MKMIYSLICAVVFISSSPVFCKEDYTTFSITNKVPSAQFTSIEHQQQERDPGFFIALACARQRDYLERRDQRYTDDQWHRQRVADIAQQAMQYKLMGLSDAAAWSAAYVEHRCCYINFLNGPIGSQQYLPPSQLPHNFEENFNKRFFLKRFFNPDPCWHSYQENFAKIIILYQNN